MTRDILDLNVGTLDVIIFAVLRNIGLPASRFYENHHGPGLDGVCEANARRFVDEFLGRPLQAIGAIRLVSGLNLRDSKAAWEQVIESYYGPTEYHVQAAKSAHALGQTQAVMYHVSKM